MIAQIFESIRLVRSGEVPGHIGEGFIPFDDRPIPTMQTEGDRYWLLLVPRWAVVDPETFEPIRATLPIPTLDSQTSIWL